MDLSRLYLGQVFANLKEVMPSGLTGVAPVANSWMPSAKLARMLSG